MTLSSPFSPEECRRRLEAATKADSFAWTDGLVGALRSDERVLCRMYAQGFRLRHRILTNRDSFSWRLYGRLHPASAGSVLEPHTQMPPVAVLIVGVFAVMALALLAFVGDIAYFLVSGRHYLELKHWGLSDSASAMFASVFFCAIFFWLLRSGRRDADSLVAFANDVLQTAPAKHAT